MTKTTSHLCLSLLAALTFTGAAHATAPTRVIQGTTQ